MWRGGDLHQSGGWFRKRIGESSVVLLLAAICCLPRLGRAELLSYNHTVRQPFNGSQSPDDARAAAVVKAKREVLEKAGTYLDSVKVVRDRQLVQNQIIALSSAILKAEIVSQKNYASGETFGVEIEATVTVDTATLEERIKKFLKDNSALAKAEKLEQREKELLAKIRALEERGSRLEAGKQQPANKKSLKKELSREYTEVSRKLTAVDANRQALLLWDRVRFVDPGKALEFLNQAIRRDDRFAEAFNNRGIAYANLGKWQQAIKDYDTAIELNPAFHEAFNNRGSAYASSGDPESAKRDFDEALRLDPKNELAYCNRGTAEAGLGRLDKAVEDFSRAIDLKSGNATFYFNRGNVYAEQQEYLKAVEDFERAIEADPGHVAAHFNRGVAHIQLGQFERALKDFDKAIQLDPKDLSGYASRGIASFKTEQYAQAIRDFDHVLYFSAKDANAYKYRGLSYLMMGEQDRFCSDLNKACSLGECADLEWVRRDGYCK